MPTTAGYSGTPLAKKLGLKPAMRVTLIEAPADYANWLGPTIEALQLSPQAGGDTALVHLFVTEQLVLTTQLQTLRKQLAPDAVLWVSWPKKASRVPSTVSEDSIRAAALPLGFVDVKVCAVSDVWSGLKLVVRKSLR